MAAITNLLSFVGSAGALALPTNSLKNDLLERKTLQARRSSPIQKSSSKVIKRKVIKKLGKVVRKSRKKRSASSGDKNYLTNPNILVTNFLEGGLGKACQVPDTNPITEDPKMLDFYLEAKDPKTKCAFYLGNKHTDRVILSTKKPTELSKNGFDLYEYIYIKKDGTMQKYYGYAKENTLSVLPEGWAKRNVSSKGKFLKNWDIDTKRNYTHLDNPNRIESWRFDGDLWETCQVPDYNPLSDDPNMLDFYLKAKDPTTKCVFNLGNNYIDQVILNTKEPTEKTKNGFSLYEFMYVQTDGKMRKYWGYSKENILEKLPEGWAKRNISGAKFYSERKEIVLRDDSIKIKPITEQKNPSAPELWKHEGGLIGFRITTKNKEAKCIFYLWKKNGGGIFLVKTKPSDKNKDILNLHEFTFSKNGKTSIYWGYSKENNVTGLPEGWSSKIISKSWLLTKIENFFNKISEALSGYVEKRNVIRSWDGRPINIITGRRFFKIGL